MNRLTIISLSLLTFISLQARENPFVATNAYEEEKARIIEQINLDIQKSQAKLLKENQQKILKNKELLTTKEVILPKPETPIKIQNKTIKPLPYLEISYNENTLSINTKYPMIRKFNLEKENKIVFDFKAIKRFTTRKETLDSKNFINVIVGNHKKNDFFRVVIKTSNKPSSYKILQENVNISILN